MEKVKYKSGDVKKRPALRDVIGENPIAFGFDGTLINTGPVRRYKQVLGAVVGLDQHGEALKAVALWVGRLQKLVLEVSEAQEELQSRIDDLEAAYPDYNKAKEQAEENKSKEIVPGFRPFTQRKRAWEAQHRKPTEKK